MSQLTAFDDGKGGANNVSQRTPLPVESFLPAEIIDTTTSATYYYHCEAAPGSATSAAAWRISRLTVATGKIEWADGNTNFDNVADNRATTVAYS